MQAKQHFGSDITIEFDSKAALYRGRMLTNKGVFEASGPDYNAVSTALTRELERELDQAIYFLDKDRGRERTLQPKKKKKKKRGKQKVSVKDLDRVSIVETVVRLISKLSFGLLDGLTAFFTGAPTKARLFVATFAGVKLTAGSKKALKKKMILARNKKLQMIMAHARSHEQNRQQLKMTQQRKTTLASRIRQKRERAKDLGEQTWQSRSRPNGKRGAKDIKRDLERLKDRVQTNRSHATELWARS